MQIAENGIGTTRPNPAVGAVIVFQETIIGEGFTAPYGGNHAEVNAVNAVKDQITGSEIQYRAEKNGIIHVGIGKGSFGNEKILENIKVFMNGIHDIKPESFGKGKKKTNNKNKGGASNAKYYLKAHLTATQGKSFNIDLRTLDVSVDLRNKY